MSKALIVIDVQKHFAVEKAADLPQKIVEHIQSHDYDYLLFTLFRNDPSSNFHKILHWYKAMGKPGIDLHPALEPYRTKDNTFEKLTYSAFKVPAFVRFVNGHDINELDICGINIDGCVLATGYEAFDLGYRVRILEDLSSVASERQEYENAAKTIIARNLKRKGGKDLWTADQEKEQYGFTHRD